MSLPLNIAFMWMSVPPVPTGWVVVPELASHYVCGAAPGANADLVTVRGFPSHIHISPLHTPFQVLHGHSVSAPASAASTTGDATVGVGALVVDVVHGHVAGPEDAEVADNVELVIAVNPTNNEPLFKEVIFIRPLAPTLDLPVGVYGLRDVAGAPSGWDRVDDHSGRFLKGSLTTTGLGGSATHTHTSPAHTHAQLPHGHTATSGGPTVSLPRLVGAQARPSASHTHSATLANSTAINNSVTVVIDSAAALPVHKRLALVTPNPAPLPPYVGLIGVWLDTDASIPRPTWQRFAAMDDFFLMAAGVGEELMSGGSATHTHTTQGCLPTQQPHTHAVSAVGTSNGTTPVSSVLGVPVSGSLHTHPVAGWLASTKTALNSLATVDIDPTTAGQHDPPYKTVIFVQYTGILDSSASAFGVGRTSANGLVNGPGTEGAATARGVARTSASGSLLLEPSEASCSGTARTSADAYVDTEPSASASGGARTAGGGSLELVASGSVSGSGRLGGLGSGPATVVTIERATLTVVGRGHVTQPQGDIAGGQVRVGAGAAALPAGDPVASGDGTPTTPRPIAVSTDDVLGVRRCSSPYLAATGPEVGPIAPGALASQVAFKLHALPIQRSDPNEIHYVASCHQIAGTYIDVLGRTIGPEVYSLGITPNGRIVGTFPDGQQIMSPIGTVAPDGQRHTMALESTGNGDGRVVYDGLMLRSELLDYGLVGMDSTLPLRLMLFNGRDGLTRVDITIYNWTIRYTYADLGWPMDENAGLTLYDWERADLPNPFNSFDKDWTRRDLIPTGTGYWSDLANPSVPLMPLLLQWYNPQSVGAPLLWGEVPSSSPSVCAEWSQQQRQFERHIPTRPIYRRVFIPPTTFGTHEL